MTKNPSFQVVNNLIVDWDFTGDSSAFYFESVADQKKPVLQGNSKKISLSQNVLLKDSGSYFLMGKISGHVEKGQIFVSATGGVADKSIIFTSETTNCKRALFSVQTDGERMIRISIGLTAGSIGQVRPDSLFFFSEKYFEDKKNETTEMKTLVGQIAGIKKFEPQAFDQQVEQIALSINGSFLRKGDPKNAKIASIFSSETFNTENTSYLHHFISDEEIRNSYCQKSSLSLDEILKLYRIPVRQIHWQKNCSGFHQFTEYYNPFDRRWKLIDIYYGVRYVNANGEYLGFEEVERMVRLNSFGKGNIEKIETGRLYYDEDEILSGWNNSDFAIGIIRK